MRSEGFWNLPNTLTVLRIFAVPWMVWILWDVPTVWEARLAMAIFVIAMIFAFDLSECALDVKQELHAVVVHLLTMLIDAQEYEALELFEDVHGVFIVLITQGERPFDL